MDKVMESFQAAYREVETHIKVKDRREIEDLFIDTAIEGFRWTTDYGQPKKLGESVLHFSYTRKGIPYRRTFWYDSSTYYRLTGNAAYDKVVELDRAGLIDKLEPRKLYRNLVELCHSADNEVVLNYTLRDGKLATIRLSKDGGMVAVHYPVY